MLNKTLVYGRKIINKKEEMRFVRTRNHDLLLIMNEIRKIK